MNMQQITQTLKDKGYEARAIYGSMVEIDQDGITHLLSYNESVELVESDLTHPVTLIEHAEKLGRNLWYSF